jgi:hypothetical protein
MSKTVAEKLLIKPGTTLWTSDPRRLESLGPLPDGVRIADGPAQATTAILFVEERAAVRRLMDAHVADLGQVSALWVAYPKGDRTDVNRDTLWPIVGEYGLRPITQVAVDEVWSALRFRPLKEGEAPFTGGR